MNFDPDSIMSGRDDAEYAPHLEKDYCSNFVCCGVPLADLHELVSHFEESHVTVVSANGMPLPPAQEDSPTDDMSSPQTASSSALESPCSEYSCTPPPPNLFPTLTSAFQPRESAFPPITTSSSRDPCTYEDSYAHGAQHLPKEEQYVFDSMLHSEAYDGNVFGGIQVPPDVYAHSQFSLEPRQMSATLTRNPASVAPQYTTNYNHQSDSTPAYIHPPTIAPTPVYARPPTLSIITEPQPQDQPTPVKKRRGEMQSWVSANEAETTLPLRRRKITAQKQPHREKAFKCPHTGCIKSYMNMNGLKYHLTKGVCDFTPR